ncbi:MAG: T9SS type A sorting domain-containing protein [Ignavibacteria bacterium]|nr:T9SS type A sorting domain-containing protein [Ignavibacteria bacterium]
MKRIFITALFIFAVTLSANSQVKFVENFSYPAGDSIGAYGWVYNSGTVNPLLVTTPGLTYTGYPLSGIGNALTIKQTGNDAYKNWTGTADSVGTIYTSFMLRVDSAQTTGDYIFALLPNNSTSIYTCRLTIKDTLTGQFKFGLSKGTVGTGVGYSGAYPKGQVVLCVIKYKFNAATTTDDESSMYVFTSGFPATEPGAATIPVVTSTATDASNLGRVAVRQGSSTAAPYCIIDGIKVGKSWGDLTTGVVATSTVADNFSLSQNYPNPFNPSTTIKFSLPSSGMTSLKVYDAMGKEVSALVNGNLSAGQYTAQFNGASLASGMYFYKLEFTGIDGKTVSEQKKLMLVK